MSRLPPGAMLCAVGDLVEDVVVALSGPIRAAADTPCRITRRRGGSAANVAAAAAHHGASARFVGRVGADELGARLVGALQGDGVDVVVERAGRTGSIVVLVEPGGERTMLTDRGASTGLAEPRPQWLDDVSVLHVPAYSLHGEPLASSTRQLLAWAAERALPCSVDTSSTTVLDALGAAWFRAELERLRPAVVFANVDEARALDLRPDPEDIPAGVGCLVLKRGAEPTVVVEPGRATTVDVAHVAASVDTTGAGDAFAAGFLVAWRAGAAPPEAAVAGHRAAAATLESRAGADA